MTNLIYLAKAVVERNQYLALNTMDENNKPWTCVLAYTFDTDYNFYFVSLPSSNHSANIKNNKDVSFAIYDSTQGFGLGVGLQIESVAEELPQEKIPNVTKIYLGRQYPYGNLSNDFTDGLKK